MLTVIKANEPAHKFYTDKLGYVVSELDPSTGGDRKPYFILEKCVSPAGRGAMKAAYEAAERGEVLPIDPAAQAAALHAKGDAAEGAAGAAAADGGADAATAAPVTAGGAGSA